ncbi:MAG: type II secretion system major pseudopilin GspG [Kiritimatiellaeota bacterium]|nr:type II secretion system major pseudopilin GspG [Kiritimatiellota bacterium]
MYSKTKDRKRQTRRAFSLIEIMVVLLIIGLVSALVAPQVIKKLNRAKVQTAQTQVRLLKNACKDYYLDMDKYPDRLEDLIQDPGSDKWDGPYLDPPKIPKDPWGNDYHYNKPGQNDRPFDIVSFGADNAPGGEKNNADINSWE